MEAVIGKSDMSIRDLESKRGHIKVKRILNLKNWTTVPEFEFNYSISPETKLLLLSKQVK